MSDDVTDLGLDVLGAVDRQLRVLFGLLAEFRQGPCGILDPVPIDIEARDVFVFEQTLLSCSLSQCLIRTAAACQASSRSA